MAVSLHFIITASSLPLSLKSFLAGPTSVSPSQSLLLKAAARDSFRKISSSDCRTYGVTVKLSVSVLNVPSVDVGGSLLSHILYIPTTVCDLMFVLQIPILDITIIIFIIYILRRQYDIYQFWLVTELFAIKYFKLTELSFTRIRQIPAKLLQFYLQSSNEGKTAQPELEWELLLLIGGTGLWGGWHLSISLEYKHKQPVAWQTKDQANFLWIQSEPVKSGLASLMAILLLLTAHSKCPAS